MNTLAKTILLLALGATPILSSAQCACSDPSEGGTISYTIEMPKNNFSTNVIQVPKLDPNIGQVTCVDIDYTYTLLSSISVRNKESVAKNYRFLYNVNPSLTIGSTSHSETFLNYYPSISSNVLLEPYGDPNDYVLFGPDVIALDNFTSFNQSINPALFSGTGTTDLIFEFSGGVTSILGGVNYEQVVSTESWGEFRINISWCPNEVLNDDLKNFSAIFTVDGIQLNWKNSAENEQNQYVIQISKDGNNFLDYSTLIPSEFISGERNYNYLITGINWDKVYVRVKLISPGKKSTFTPIKVVQKEIKNNQTIHVSPNPASDQTNIIFPAPLTGQYKVEMIGINGQVVHHQNIRMTNQAFYNLKFSKLSAGVYYLRVLNVNSPETFVTKVYISN